MKYYTDTHLWLEEDTEGRYRIGVTQYGVESLGDIVAWEEPDEGRTYKQGEMFASLESRKAVQDLLLPEACSESKCLAAGADNAFATMPQVFAIALMEGTFDPSKLMNENEYMEMLKKE